MKELRADMSDMTGAVSQINGHTPASLIDPPPKQVGVSSRFFSSRLWGLALVHLALLTLAYRAAFLLRFDLSIPDEYSRLFWQTLPAILATKIVVFYVFGSFHGWWRYVTFSDLATLLRAALTATVLIAVVDHLFVSSLQIPRSVVLMDLGATVLLFGGLRSSRRLLREHLWPDHRGTGQQRAFMIGACDGGDLYANQIHQNPRLDFRVVGFLDDNRAFRGTRLGGIPFLGTTAELVPLARRYLVEDLLIIANSITGPDLRRVMDACRAAGITIKMIPPVDDLLHGSDRLQVRDVDINDLLRREPVQLETGQIDEMLSSRVAMVTGAGGSIGSEICRQVLRCEPKRIVLVERAENNLFFIENELAKVCGEVEIVACVADVGNESRMRSLFEQFRPDIVFHAAAHKHVPLMEREPSEAITNNILATRLLAGLADAFMVERFVMISTDKAVNPTSVMGVSKQIAERCVHAFSETSPTRFVSVRFGNVLASAGSVVPVFLEQIRNGGPITVTHREMTRYFMTIPEASQLVLQAAAIGEGGEIFVLDMGQPVRIMDLAEDLLHLAGHSQRDIEIKEVGTRPGEKLYEEMYFDDEQTMETAHPKIRMAHHRPYSMADVQHLISELISVLNEPPDVIRDKMRELVPDYAAQPEHIAEPVNTPIPAKGAKVAV